MKRFMVILAALLLSTTAAFAQFSIGVGYSNLKSFEKMNKETLKSMDPLNGFYVGADYTIKIWKGLGITPGVQFLLQSGISKEDLGSIASFKEKLTECYVNIPVSVNYGFELGSILRLYAFAGPEFGISISSISEKITEMGSGSSSIKDNLLTGDDALLKRFDVALGGGVGLDVLRKVRVKGGYYYGLINKSNNEAYTRHNGRWELGVAYIF